VQKLRDERGFTLPELMVAIAILGILAAIAIPVWWGVSESRALDSAANQVAADLRLAHTGATNRLQSWQVVFTSGSPTYTVGPAGSPTTRTLPDGTVAATSATLTFSPRGSVAPADGSTTTVRVAAAGDPANDRDIEVNTSTSMVEIDV
jgi:prepilin-type N-terminal cleavage/methylation domain-containing protein